MGRVLLNLSFLFWNDYAHTPGNENGDGPCPNGINRNSKFPLVVS